MQKNYCFLNLFGFSGRFFWKKSQYMDVKLRGSFRFEAMRIISNSQKKSTRRQKVVTITRTNEQHKAIECMKFGKYVFIFDGFQVSNVRKKSEKEEKKMNDRNDSYLLRMWFYLLLDICSLWKIPFLYVFSIYEPVTHKRPLTQGDREIETEKTHKHTRLNRWKWFVCQI